MLTRAAHAGADYTGRNNKFVHHLLLDVTDRADAGPAWMLARPGLMRTAWDGDPQTIPTPPDLPTGDAPPATCDAWRRATGDAGWAGVLAEWHLLNPAAPAWLVYDPEQHDRFALTAESIALLPPAHRWSVTFSTYFTDTPGGPECAWRWVIAGTPAAHSAVGDRVIDLTRRLDPARDSRYVHAARHGGHVVDPETRSVRPAPPATTPDAISPPTPPPSPTQTSTPTAPKTRCRPRNHPPLRARVAPHGSPRPSCCP